MKLNRHITPHVLRLNQEFGDNVYSVLLTRHHFAGRLSNEDVYHARALLMLSQAWACARYLLW